MPWSSNTASSSRCWSSASAYWKPEQPPPRTPTRRPASSSADWLSRNCETFSAAKSVSVTMGGLYRLEATLPSAGMPSAAEIRTRIEQALPGASARVEDLTGGGDHFRAEVVSDRFEGLSRIEQHQLVYGVFRPAIGGPIHALSLKTATPERTAT